MMNQSVNHGGDHLIVSEYSSPFGKFQDWLSVSGFYFHNCLISPEIAVENHLCLLVHIPTHQGSTGPGSVNPGEALQESHFAGFRQFQNQFRYSVKLCFISKIAGFHTRRDCLYVFSLLQQDPTVQGSSVRAQTPVILTPSPAKSRRKFDMLVTVSFKCFVVLETRPV